jgi:PAP2 superfamily
MSWRVFMRSPGLHEVALFAVALLVYQLSRALVIGDATTAVTNAVAIIDYERALGVLVEPDIQGWALGIPGLTASLNVLYVCAHLPLTAGFFIWLWRRRPANYPLMRNGFLAANAIALAVYITYPVAPPRLTKGDGIGDTLRSVSGIDLHAGPLSGLFNPYAAVPSMHFGYAAMIGVGGWLLFRTWPARLAAGAYPALVLLMIVATGNHYLIDAAAALAVMVAAFTLSAISRRKSRGQSRAGPHLHEQFHALRSKRKLAFSTRRRRDGLPADRHPATHAVNALGIGLADGATTEQLRERSIPNEFLHHRHHGRHRRSTRTEIALPGRRRPRARSST